MSGIVEFLTARLDEDEATAKDVPTDLVGRDWTTAESGGYTGGRIFLVGSDTPWQFTGVANSHDEATATYIARHDPARVLREVKAKRRILELHTTGSYRTYQCSNGDHIQEWQCERAKEPYTEDRYCEVCGGSKCVELPLLAAAYERHPDYDPAWRVE